MSSKVKEIEKEALQLEPRERALLAEHLIGSLDPEEDPEAERLWIEEAERRYQAYKEGRVKAKPAEMVLREARRSAHRSPNYAFRNSCTCFLISR